MARSDAGAGPPMTSSRPYLIRAIQEWILDNGLTPLVVVKAGGKQVRVPEKHIEDGKIVLNISPSATQGLHLGNECVEFSARFGGTPFQVSFPPGAVLAVYARENGVGMAFQGEEPEGEPPAPSGQTSQRPGLRVVK